LVLTNSSQAHIRFETTFFSLLQEFREIKDSMRAEDSRNRQLHGVDALTALCFSVFKMNNGDEYIKLSALNTKEDIDLQYSSFYRKFEEQLGPYFRMVYRILKYLDQAPGGTNWQREFCAGVLRAQLSKSELWLILVNALSVHSEGKMKPLVEKYRLLQHLPKSVYGTDLSRLRNQFLPRTFE
ncbi:MAG: putative phage abortive infection protein, partial [Burkholderiaceae bacterium]